MPQKPIRQNNRGVKHLNRFKRKARVDLLFSPQRYPAQQSNVFEKNGHIFVVYYKNFRKFKSLCDCRPVAQKAKSSASHLLLQHKDRRLRFFSSSDSIDLK
ncbi:MAG: hypothetical protein D6715_01635 [Calditrichaeota bacterium]|nr:MAG: hypothetical protein D6715_01635 [Calditrichota bacterium]